MNAVAYRIWDDYYGYVSTTRFQCLGVTKSGQRCERYVSDGLFCKLHCHQEEQLDQQIREFFGIKVNPKSSLDFK